MRMNWPGACLIRVAAVLVLGFSPVPAVEDEERVENAFYAYKVAIMNDRGAEAVDLLSRSTVDYYGRMRDLALYATRAELEKESTINLMQALVLRLRVPTDELRRMNGRSVLEHALDRGWVGKNSVAAVDVKDIRVSGETAVIEIASDRESGTARMRFVKEQGDWKLDLMLVMQAAGATFEALARQQGLSREEFMLIVLSGMSGEAATEAIWEPPLQRPARE